MDKVMSVIEEWRARIEPHALHQWIAAEDDGVELEQKLWFSLYFMNFIMYFRELNIYHVGYRGQSGANVYCDAITRHADEDLTHSRLFMRDFKTLGWDKSLGWRPSEVFHWLFTHPATEGLRRRTVKIAKLYIESQDPFVRFAVVESIEACGNALFRHTTKLADRYKLKTGKDLVYFGAFHLARETGHAVDSEDEGLFHGLQLSDEQRERATARAVRAFELIEEQNTDMLQLAQKTIHNGGFRDQRRGPMIVELLPDPPMGQLSEAQATAWPNAYEFNFWPNKPHVSQQPLVQRLLEALHEVRSVQLGQLFDTHDPAQMLASLRLGLMYFATDCTGTPTFYQNMVTYSDPQTLHERAINRIASRFGLRSKLLYVDWQSLSLDEKLGWPVSRTLEFIYLDRATETHRDLRAVITHHIDVTDDPLLRYWTIVTLKTVTNAHSDVIARLARRAERQFGISLPYMASRQCAALEIEADPELDGVEFDSLPVDAATVRAVEGIIAGIARAAVLRGEKMLESVRNVDYPEVLSKSAPALLEGARSSAASLYA